MMRVYSTIVLAVAVFGCGGVQTLDPRGSSDEDEGVAVSASSICGTSCGQGLHRTSVFCNLACGNCLTGTNAATCDFDQGQSFDSCNNSCPSGYHTVGHGCNPSCGSCISGPNAATCELNAGISFGSCDLSCPSGYQATSFVCDPDCGFCSSVNAAICTATTSCSLAEGPTTVALGGAFDFTISSTMTIPAGFSSFWYGTKNGVMDAVRVPTGGTTGGFLFTNVAGINGSYVRWAQFEDAQGHVLCSTNSQNTNLLP